MRARATILVVARRGADLDGSDLEEVPAFHSSTPGLAIMRGALPADITRDDGPTIARARRLYAHALRAPRPTREEWQSPDYLSPMSIARAEMALVGLVREGWVLTHLNTGLRLPFAFSQLADAVRVAQILGDLLDWRPEIEQSAGADACRRAARIFEREQPQVFQGHAWGRESDDGVARWFVL